jgi:hypothetical protein
LPRPRRVKQHHAEIPATQLNRGLWGSRIVSVMVSYVSPDDREPETGARSYSPNQESPSALAAVRDRNEARLLAVDGVKGVGIGRNQIGQDALVIYIVDQSVSDRLPRTIEKFPVVLQVTGEIEAL